MTNQPGDYGGTTIRSTSFTGYTGAVNEFLTVTPKVFIQAIPVTGSMKRYQPAGALCVEDETGAGLTNSMSAVRVPPGDALLLHPFYDPVDPLTGFTDVNVCSLVPIEADGGGIAGYLQIRRTRTICEGSSLTVESSPVIPDISSSYIATNNFTTDIDTGDGVVYFSTASVQGGAAMISVSSLECEWMSVGTNTQTQENIGTIKTKVGQKRTQRRKS